MLIDGLCKVAAMDQEAGGWAKRTFGENIALIHSELSEALEEYRSGHAIAEGYYVVDKNGINKPMGIPSELADTVIRIAALCGVEGINLAAVIEEKLAYNRTRGLRHGGKTL